MAYPMSHLCVAKKIVDLSQGKIRDLPQFYLGNIAPDAVHFREDFTGVDKKETHLCISDDAWGFVTNNDEWIEDVLSFLSSRVGSSDFDFYLGYCTHILTDICNNINVWTAFRTEHPGEWDGKGYGDILHIEAAAVDLQLSQRFEAKKEVWDELEKSHIMEIEGRVSKEEVDRIRTNILYIQYSGIEQQDTTKNKLVTHESTKRFIDLAVDFVMQHLRKIKEISF